MPKLPSHRNKEKVFFGGGVNRLGMSVLFLQLRDQTKFCFDVTVFLETTLILQSAIQYQLQKMRDKHMFLLYISSSLLRKRLTHAYRLTLMSFFIKIMMGNCETCPIITPDSFFFKGAITGHHFRRYCTILPETNFTFQKSFQVFTSQTNKSVLN